MSVTITIDTVRQVVMQLGLSDKLDSSILYQALEHEALKTAPPPLDPQQRTALVSAARSMTPGEPVPPYSSKAAPATLDADEIAKRRNLVQRAKSDFKGAMPVAFLIISPLSSYENLPFVCCQSITVFSRTYKETQMFENVWCLWDSGAQSCMVAMESLNDAVKTGVEGPDFLSMDVVIWGANTRISTPLVIKPAAHMPQQSRFFILGQKFFLEQLEYTVTPNAVKKLQDETTYGTVSVHRYTDASIENPSPIDFV